MRSRVATPRVFVYYEETKQELKRVLIHECRCNERLNAKTERSTRLAYTGLREGLEHLKIETRLRGERFESVKGMCDLEAIGAPSIFKLIRRAAALARTCPTFDLSCEENAARR